MVRRSWSPWAWVTTLYFAEGIPYVAVMTIATILYKQLGLSNAQITLYTSWLYLPWVIKPLWSPFVDVIGTKRGWISAMQFLIGAALAGVAFTIPTASWLQGTLCCFWLLAFSSATHDIAADGFYMLGMSTHEQAFFVGIRSTCYRLATIFGQGVLVMIAGNLQVIYRNSIAYSWCLTFYGAAGLFLALWLYHTAVLPRPESDLSRCGITIVTLWRELWHTVKTFFVKDQAIIGILFMLLYRMPEGLLAKVSALFLIDAPHNGGLGLSPQEYGFVQGTVGVVGLTLGGILGGLLCSRDGLRRWLWPMVVAITLPDIIYVVLAYTLPTNVWLISGCVFTEQFGYGFGFTAYMLYLIFFSQGPYKTSHYALCTALMALSMMLPGMFAGALQEAVGYRQFFIIVCIACLVTYVITACIRVSPTFGKKEEK